MSKHWFAAGVLAMCVLGAAMVVSAGEVTASDEGGIWVTETQEARDERMAWWREARFGMFIHWGLYAVPAGEWKGKTNYAEWIRTKAQIPVETYNTFVPQFNPVKFDADAWVKLAKRAGMKYITITSKHHDGFCLWPSKVSDYDIEATPFKRDILAELTDACRKHKVRMTFYHSIMDWHHPDYLPRRPWERAHRPDGDADYSNYVTYMKAQLKELVDDYDPSVMWFDGEWEKSWTHEMGKDLYQYMRDLKPDIIVNNRVDKGRHGMAGMSKGNQYRGDFCTPEQQIPAKGLPGVDWESCMTMNRHWGWNKADTRWKSSEDLIRKLVDIASKGGNFLLNIGPKADGTFPDEAIERLEAIGKWMDTNSKSIYATTASPFGKVPFGRVTHRTDKKTLYLHVFNWPADGKLVLQGMSNRVKKARLLTSGRKLRVDTPDENLVELTVPMEAPDPIATVIAVTYKGELKVEPYVQRTKAAPDGGFTLTHKTVDIEGSTLHYEKEKDCLGFWTTQDDRPVWHLADVKAGTYQVEIQLACPDHTAGTPCRLKLGNREIKFKVPATGSWATFKSHTLPEVNLDAAALLDVTVIADRKPNEGVMNLRSVRLVPKQ